MRRPTFLAAAAALCLVSGYLLLAAPPAAGSASRTLAPLLLATAYCGLVPAAILTHRRRASAPPAPGSHTGA